MNPILEQWLADIANRQPAQLNQSGLVEGVRDKPLGPRSDYAKITVAFEPASQLEVECSAVNRSELEADGYLQGALLGLLDVLLTDGTYPLRNVKLTITAAEIHPIHSSQMAFRWAGRDAGTKLLGAILPRPRVS